jgi:hypothetical protein
MLLSKINHKFNKNLQFIFQILVTVFYIIKLAGYEKYHKTIFDLKDFKKSVVIF